jgi:hypothetical protein
MVKGPHGFLFSGYQGAFHWWEKQPSHEVQHLFAPHAQVKSEWSYTPSSPICLHVVEGTTLHLLQNFVTWVLINNAMFHTHLPCHQTAQHSTSHPHQPPVCVAKFPATSSLHHHCHWLFIPVILTSLLVQQWVSDSLTLKMTVDMA